MSFPVPRNVGPTDRVLRVVAGAAGTAAPLLLGAPLMIAVPAVIFASSIAVSGLLGRCSIYHALGHSTLPPT